MAQPTDTNSAEVDDFREAMPATADSFYNTAEDDGRFIAVVTLVLVALVMLGLALLFWRGLDTIRGTVQPHAPAAQPQHQSDSSGSLEL